MIFSHPSRPARVSKAVEWLAGLVGCAALGTLYIITRTEVHTFDALSYTWALEDKPFGLLFHPHHLLYGPLGWLAYQIALLVGYNGRADIPVQILNAVAGALGIFFFWRFGCRWTGRWLVALGVALLIGLCYAYWLYAAEVEVYTLATAFLTLTLWILTILDEKQEVRWALALGVAHTGAIMFHQTNLLFGLAIGVFLLSRPNLRRLSILVAYGVTVVVLLVAAYGYVAYTSEFPDWPAFYRWFSDYAQRGQWGGFLSLAHFPALRSGLQTAVSIEPWLAALFYVLVAIGLLGSIWRARQERERRAWLMLAGVWFITYLLFFWWWEPWNIEFWIAILPLWGVVLLSAWSPVRTHSAGVVANTDGLMARIRFGLYVLYSVMPFLIAIQLLRSHLGPIQEMGDASQDYYRQVTDALTLVVQPEELVVTRGNVLDLYIPFYAGHPHLLSLRHLEHQKGGDRAQIIGELLGQLDWAIVTGRPFLIDQFILDEEREPILNPFGLLSGEIETIRTRYPLQPLAFRGDHALFYGTPRFDNLGRTEWVFADSLQGWSAWGIDAPRFERGGWCFTGGIDPQLKGPLINLDAKTSVILALDITLEADSSSAQIFWRSPDGEYSLAQSLDQPLRRGRHVYRIAMDGMPGWVGIIAQVRIDPIPGSEEKQPGVMACVHSVQFLKK